MGRSSICPAYAGVFQDESTEMSQRFLKITDDNLLTQCFVLHREILSYLILTDKEDLITELKISGFLGANDCNLISLHYAKGIKDIPKRYKLGV